MFRGIVTPVMTALDHARRIDYKATESIIEFLLIHRIDGLLFLGSSGEFFAFSAEEKRQLIRFACKQIQGRCKILVGTGGTDIQEVIDLTHYAADCGADAAVIVSPYYFAFDENIVSRFYRSILQKTRLPVIAYNFPERTGYSLNASQLKQLAVEFPQFIGVKDTVNNISHTREIIQAVKPVRENFRVYSGYDEYYLANLIAGGDGAISAISNFLPGVFRRLYDAFSAGDFAAACQNARIISDAMPIYCMSDPFIPAIKAAMQAVGLPVTTQSREPIPDLTAEQAAKILAFVTKLRALSAT